MNIDETFWVAVAFFIFIGVLIYLKVPKKINDSLNNKIGDIKKEISEAEKLKEEAKNVLSNYESKINKAQKDSINILNQAKKESEKIIIENTEKFYDFIENRKKTTEQKIIQMKEDALKDIKNISVKITIEAIEKLIKNSIDKKKLDKLYDENLEQAKILLKKTIV